MVEYRYPVKGVRTQGFRDNPNNGPNGAGGHLGIDIACAEGTPVRACGDGTILFSNWASNLPGGVSNPWAFVPSAAGGLVLMDHGPGEPASSYGHMMETYFNEGDFVKGGTIIGLADTTGLATGSHVHFDFLAPVYHMVPPMWGRVNPDDYCHGYWDDVTAQGGGLIVDNIVDNLFVTGGDGVRRRTAPDKNAPLMDEFLPDRELVIGGYVHGVAPYPDTTDIWLVGGISGGYMWLGSFHNQDISAIPDITPAITPPTTPPGVPDTPPVVVAPPYDFVLDFTEVNGITVEKIPAHNTNVDTGNMPARVDEIVDHWWNDPSVKPQFDNVTVEFTREATYKSPHWMVSEYRIAQMVSMVDRAYHAGPEGNNRYGFEIDPKVVEKNPDGTYTAAALRVQENVRALHRAIELKKGYELRARLHNEFMNTRCAAIDLLTVEPDREDVVIVIPPATNELDDFLGKFEEFIRDYRTK